MEQQNNPLNWKYITLIIFQTSAYVLQVVYIDIRGPQVFNKFCVENVIVARWVSRTNTHNSSRI